MITLRMKREAHCRFDTAVRAIETFFLQHASARGRIATKPGGYAVCEIGEIRDHWEASEDDVLIVWWTASPGPQFPLLCGHFTATANGLTTTIITEAVYSRNPGFTGTIFDRFVGRRFAKKAVKELCEQLMSFVEKEFGLERLLRDLLHN